MQSEALLKRKKPTCKTKQVRPWKTRKQEALNLSSQLQSKPPPGVAQQGIDAQGTKEAKTVAPVFEERKNFIERLTLKETGLKSVSSIQLWRENERGWENFKLGSWSIGLESAHTSRECCWKPGFLY